MSNHYGYNRRRFSGGKIALMLVCAALVYAGVLVGIQLIGNRLEPEKPETVGSLENRFDTEEHTLEYGGRTYAYKEQALTNLLLIGVDWIAQDEDAGRYAGQADFLLLLTMNRESKTVSALQLDRDTMTEIRVFGPFGDYTGIRETQLCLAYAYGETPEKSCENTAWAVSRLLGGIPIDGCLAMSISGIAALNDALGGVTVTLEEDFSGLDPLMTAGKTLTLQGKQAEYFVRGRMQVGDGTNVSRMRRQRAFIQAAADAFFQGINADMNYAGRVLDALSGCVTTDMERGWLINKMYACREYQREDIAVLAGSHSVGADGFMEFHADADALGALLTSAFFE